MRGLRVAVPKGAIFDDALAALGAAGMPVEVLREDGRRLLYRAEGADFIVSRPSDVPVFVEHGAADVGIVGKDVLGALGLRPGEDFALVLGQAAFYRGYLNNAAPGVAAEVLAALADKDLVRVDEISGILRPELAATVREIPRLVGPAADGSVLERAARYAGEGGEAAVALENLRGILDHLWATGSWKASCWTSG